MRVAVVTDVHFGPPTRFQGKLRKLTDHAAPLLRQAVATAIEARADLLINLGDVIEDQSRDLDIGGYEQLLAGTASFPGPVLHVAGNHDTINLSAEDLAGLWRRPEPLFYSEDHGGVRFIVLHSVETPGERVHLPEDQLGWLEQELASTSLPAIVLVHHPLGEISTRGNRWFESYPHLCLVENRAAARRIIERSGKVLLVLNGHVHWNHVSLVNGVGYVTLQSMTENLDEDAPGRPSEAMALVDVEEGRALVSVLGRETARYEICRG